MQDLGLFLGHVDMQSNTDSTANIIRHRIFWKDIQATKGVNLEFDGIPFIILGHKLLECQNGPDRNRALKEKMQKTLR